jgi:HAE1 family hydrophobic/amphiphilic exporter-1
MTLLKKSKQIINETEGVAFSTMVVGYSMLTQSFSTNNAFVFISLENRGKNERKQPKQLIQQTNLAFRNTISDATAIAFGPPPIEGLGNFSRFYIATARPVRKYTSVLR